MKAILEKLDVPDEQQGAGTGSWLKCAGKIMESFSPIDGRVIGKIRCAGKGDYEEVVTRSVRAFEEWRMVPAPKRGEIVRQIGEAMRKHKEDLGALVSLEVGKIRAEGEGEVQEMIDITDFALGQSRMLYGLTMHSERPEHRMYEQWHPLGPVGVITAFNFPVAVWSWNAMISLVAGDTVIWKPSSKAPLTAIAIMKIAWRVLQKNGLPEGVLSLVIGDRKEIGETFIKDQRIPLISATGSVPMGRHISEVVAGRLGKTILELGGNNAIIVAPSAELNLAVRGIVFGAVGTAGQRCTTTRRIIVHKDIFGTLAERLVKAYKQVPIGNPLEKNILMGPLIDRAAVDAMQKALEEIRNQGGKILCGGEVLSGDVFDAGTYVTPCICEIGPDAPIVKEETFAPILYMIRYDTLEKAIAYQNDVPQGLSSAILTRDLPEAETFLSHRGSDCGIANVNIGTSGAEIGGAFGGEKETGGGRESGSDAWKAYMRRQTCTINWSKELPLAQGIRFDVD
ncbi:Aldehyde dehydrogenase [Desulfonema magnum]|uniref:aldehyde dehydrogenase (NAD(+)) n=2 Tax=Desulfonema magnum TaxID=45655 RepID=A0A975GS91_9BACT|nr:Aldehyde dehydrogenase [Desulfonema magnum]